MSEYKRDLEIDAGYMKKIKIGLAAIIILVIAMDLTSPGKDKHFDEYLKNSSLSSKVMNAVVGQEKFGNLFVLSYYKRDDYFSLGLFGKVFVLNSN